MTRWMMIAAFAAATLVAGPAAAQVDYHKAQQAGKVWERKIGENDRGPRRPVDNRPITAAERSEALARHRADYDRLVSSVGTDNADKWLGFKIRQARRGD